MLRRHCSHPLTARDGIREVLAIQDTWGLFQCKDISRLDGHRMELSLCLYDGITYNGKKLSFYWDGSLSEIPLTNSKIIFSSKLHSLLSNLCGQLYWVLNPRTKITERMHILPLSDSTLCLVIHCLLSTRSVNTANIFCRDGIRQKNLVTDCRQIKHINFNIRAGAIW